MQEVLGSNTRLGGLGASPFQASRGIRTLQSRASGLQSTTKGIPSLPKKTPPRQTKQAKKSLRGAATANAQAKHNICYFIISITIIISTYIYIYIYIHIMCIYVYVLIWIFVSVGLSDVEGWNSRVRGEFPGDVDSDILSLR